MSASDRAGAIGVALLPSAARSQARIVSCPVGPVVVEKPDLDLVGEAGLHAKGEDHAADHPDVTAAAAGVDRADLVHEAHDVAAGQQRERFAHARDILAVDRGDRAEQPRDLGRRARRTPDSGRAARGWPPRTMHAAQQQRRRRVATAELTSRRSKPRRRRRSRPCRPAAGSRRASLRSCAASTCRGRARRRSRGRCDTLPMPPGRVDHQVRDRQARDVAAQLLHQLDAGLDGRAQVDGARGDVALEQVVRAHAQRSSSVNSLRSTRADEFTPRSSTVWLPTGMPASASCSHAARACGVSSLGWLKCVLTNSGWYFLQHRAQLVVDAHRQHDRHARADADDLDVRDRAQRGEDLLEARGRQRQRIAARDQHVADGGRAADVVERARRDPRARSATPPAPPGGGGCSGGSRSRSDRAPAAGSDRDSGGRCRSRASGCPRRADRRSSPGSISSSRARGITCMRTGHDGCARSISEK